MKERSRRFLITLSWCMLVGSGALLAGLLIGRPLFYTDGAGTTFAPRLAQATMVEWATPGPVAEIPGPVVGRMAELPDGSWIYGRMVEGGDTSDLVRFDPARPDLGAEPVFSLNSPAFDLAPSVAADGTVYFASDREGGAGGFDIYQSRYVQGAFTVPRPLEGPLAQGVNTAQDETDPAPAPLGDRMVFVRRDPRLLDGRNGVLYRVDAGGAAQLLFPAELERSRSRWPLDRDPSFSADGVCLWFVRDLPGAPKPQIMRAWQSQGTFDVPVVHEALHRDGRSGWRSPLLARDGSGVLLVAPALESGATDPEGDQEGAALVYLSRPYDVYPWRPAQRPYEYIALAVLVVSLVLLALLYMGRRWHALDLVAQCLLLSLLVHLLLLLWLAQMEIAQEFFDESVEEGGFEVQLVSAAATSGRSAEVSQQVADLAASARFAGHQRTLVAAAPEAELDAASSAEADAPEAVRTVELAARELETQAAATADEAEVAPTRTGQDAQARTDARDVAVADAADPAQADTARDAATGAELVVATPGAEVATADIAGTNRQVDAMAEVGRAERAPAAREVEVAQARANDRAQADAPTRQGRDAAADVAASAVAAATGAASPAAASTARPENAQAQGAPSAAPQRPSDVASRVGVLAAPAADAATALVSPLATADPAVAAAVEDAAQAADPTRRSADAPGPTVAPLAAGAAQAPAQPVLDAARQVAAVPGAGDVSMPQPDTQLARGGRVAAPDGVRPKSATGPRAREVTAQASLTDAPQTPQITALAAGDAGEATAPVRASAEAGAAQGDVGAAPQRALAAATGSPTTATPGSLASDLTGARPRVPSVASARAGSLPAPREVAPAARVADGPSAPAASGARAAVADAGPKLAPAAAASAGGPVADDRTPVQRGTSGTVARGPAEMGAVTSDLLGARPRVPAISAARAGSLPAPREVATAARVADGPTVPAASGARPNVADASPTLTPTAAASAGGPLTAGRAPAQRVVSGTGSGVEAPGPATVGAVASDLSGARRRGPRASLGGPRADAPRPRSMPKPMGLRDGLSGASPGVPAVAAAGAQATSTAMANVGAVAPQATDPAAAKRTASSAGVVAPLANASGAVGSDLAAPSRRVPGSPRRLPEPRSARPVAVAPSALALRDGALDGAALGAAPAAAAPARSSPQLALAAVAGPQAPAVDRPVRDGAERSLSGGPRAGLALPQSFMEVAPRRREGPTLPAVAMAATPYSNRFGPAKAKALETFGGNEATEAAVAAGLRYLASIQNPDGSWGPQEHRDGKYGQVHIGKTGLCLLAFLGAGHTPDSRTKYSARTQRAIDYLLSVQRQDSGAFGATSSYGHGIASYALAECYGLTKDEALIEPVGRALGWILRNQTPRRDRTNIGGWGYFSDTLRREDSYARASITAWMVMALESAKLAGFDIPEKPFDDARRFLEGCFDERRGWFRYNHLPSRLKSDWPTLPASTPASAFALMLLGTDSGDDMIRTAADYTVSRRPRDYRRYPDDEFVLRGQGNVYFYYYGSLCAFLVGGDTWDRWNVALKRVLPEAQQRDGSWRPIDVYSDYAADSDGDRSYTTAMCVLSLEVYYRYFTPLLKHR